MEAKEQRRVIEALILASVEPITLARIADILPYGKPATVKDRINELNTEYAEQDRAFEIWEVAGGYQIRTRAEFSGYLQKLRKERPLRLSQAALEVLAIIAYKQPVTRAELEHVRGVDTGAVIKSLLERKLVKILGQKEVPGRPLLYGTHKRFLEVFGLESLDKLPTLRELEELAREQGVELPGLMTLERLGEEVESEEGVEGGIEEGVEEGVEEGEADGEPSGSEEEVTPAPEELAEDVADEESGEAQTTEPV
jgi:segregation and condensation protein B